MFQTTLSVQNSAAMMMATADARSAADYAANLARSAADWAMRAGLAADDAAEVLAAAVRARHAAESAELADSPDAAWNAARAAWAAVTSAQEADARINTAIADSFFSV